MKNEAITYLLIILVLIVWGIIFNKVFNSNNDETLVHRNINTLLPNDTLITIHNYQLKTDYKEPFLGTSRKINKHIITKTKIIKPAIPFPKEDFHYLGMIKNSRKKSILAIVKWKGTESYLSIGDVIDNIKIVKIDVI